MSSPSHADAETFALFIAGDILGKAGRRCVQHHLRHVVEKFHVEGVIANGENAASGIGITPPVAEEIFHAGVHVITSGNHIWKYREIQDYLQVERRIVRPLNYPPGAPGRGYTTFKIASGALVGVINLQGRVFMDPLDCPFRAADALLEKVRLGRDADALIVDFHAEATSEKQAMAYYLDGRVTAVLGTHTHVPTADQRILPGGTGFMTDIGMSGCYDSIIGMQVESVMPKMVGGLPTRFEPATTEGTLCGAVVKVNRRTGRCNKIIPVRRGAILSETEL